jgi:hypothetical protein
MSRKLGIEIRINTSAISETEINKLKANYDVEYYAKINEMVLWVHDNGYKPFNRELFQYLGALKSAYNRRTGTDHLDFYKEVSTKEQIGEFGEVRHKEDETVKYYRNLRPADLFEIDLNDIILKREL